MRRQAVINRASGTTTGSSLWRIVMPHLAVLEPDEAAVHGAARQDDAAQAFAAVAVPAEDVRGVAHLSERTAPTNATPSPLAPFQ